ncbi:unnamed protein product, partial [Cylicostephanus goldi]
TLSPLRKFSGILRKSSITPPASPTSSPPGSPSWCLWLVSALQGHVFNGEERQKLAYDIEQMSEVEQDIFIEFLKTGVAPSTLENNACKQFVCNTTDLCNALICREPQPYMKKCHRHED